MINVKTYTRIPDKYKSQGTRYGSNSEFYLDIAEELKKRKNEAEEVHLALYLFNNSHLYQELSDLAKMGVRVVVTSLPLAGYDRRKIDGATDVYGRILENRLVELRIFPHMYMWYGAEYARSGASYSFHVKAGMIEYKDGTSKIFLSSGNLAPGDPTHSETGIFIEAENSSPFCQSFSAFLSEIERRAKPYEEYAQYVQGLKPNLQQVFDFSFVGGMDEVNCSVNEASGAFFTAPFVKLEGIGSNHYARKRIVEAIQSADKRVLLCAQHIHDISPFDGFSGPTVIGALMEANSSRKINAKVLKQVSSSGLRDKRRAAFVECHLHYAGIPQKVNRLIHDKFIVADDTVLITTSNFTATQFGWGERQMEFKTGADNLSEVEETVSKAQSFFGVSPNQVRATQMRRRTGSFEVKVSKDDIFSEVNGFVEIRDETLATEMENYFNSLWTHSLSSNVSIPK